MSLWRCKLYTEVVKDQRKGNQMYYYFLAIHHIRLPEISNYEVFVK